MASFLLKNRNLGNSIRAAEDTAVRKRLAVAALSYLGRIQHINQAEGQRSDIGKARSREKKTWCGWITNLVWNFSVDRKTFI